MQAWILACATVQTAQRQFHADPANNGCVLPSYDHFRAVGKPAVIAVRIADRHSRDDAVCFRCIRSAVGKLRARFYMPGRYGHSGRTDGR